MELLVAGGASTRGVPAAQGPLELLSRRLINPTQVRNPNSRMLSRFFAIQRQISVARNRYPTCRPPKIVLRSPALRQLHSAAIMSKRALDPDRQPIPAKPIPSNYESVTFADEQYTAVKEGLASILFRQPNKPEATESEEAGDIAIPDNVFYNPIQQFNRDLSVLAIKTFGDLYVTERTKKPRRSAPTAPDTTADSSPNVPMAEASAQVC